jgi:hypothetical protein
MSPEWYEGQMRSVGHLFSRRNIMKGFSMDASDCANIRNWVKQDLQARRLMLMQRCQSVGGNDKKNKGGMRQQIKKMIAPAIEKFALLAQPDIPDKWKRKAIHSLISVENSPENWSTPAADLDATLSEGRPPQSSLEAVPRSSSPFPGPLMPEDPAPIATASDNIALPDLNTQTFTISKDSGDIQRTAAWPIRKDDKQFVKHAFDLDHRKFLATMKEEGDYDISKHLVYAYHHDGTKQHMHSSGGFLAQVIWWCETGIRDWIVHIRKKGTAFPTWKEGNTDSHCLEMPKASTTAHEVKASSVGQTHGARIKREHSEQDHNGEETKRVKTKPGMERNAPELIDDSDDDAGARSSTSRFNVRLADRWGAL